MAKNTPYIILMAELGSNVSNRFLQRCQNICVCKKGVATFERVYSTVPSRKGRHLIIAENLIQQ